MLWAALCFLATEDHIQGKGSRFSIAWKREGTERGVGKLTSKSPPTTVMFFAEGRLGVTLRSSHSLFLLGSLACSARYVVLMKSGCRYNTHITIFPLFQSHRHPNTRQTQEGLSKDRMVSIVKGRMAFAHTEHRGAPSCHHWKALGSFLGPLLFLLLPFMQLRIIYL